MMADRLAHREATFGPSALLTPANAVTVLRVASAPALFALVVSGGPSWLAAALWVVVAATDGVDGWVARRHGTTRSGAFLDPLADKMVMLAVMAALVVVGSLWWLPVAVIAAREVGMSLYRTREARRGVSVPASRLGKLKTLLQDLAVGLALLPPVSRYAPGAVSGALWLAVVLTLASGAQYLIEARRIQPARGRGSLRSRHL